MGKYDDLQEMGAMAESMGDEFPSAETRDDSHDQPDEEQGILDTVDFVGSEETYDGTLTMDDILGLSPRKAAPRQEPDREPEAKDGESRTGTLDDRVSELAEANRYLREQNEKLVSRLLGGGGEANEGGDGGQEEDDLSPQTIEYFRKYGLVTKADMQELIEAIEPIRQLNKDKAIASFIAQHVEGFTVDNMPALYDAIGKSDAAQKALYGEGMAGAVLLARDLAERGALGLGSRKRSGPSLASRHHTEAGGASRRSDDGDSEEAQIRQLEAMSADKVLSILDRLS